MASVSLAPAAEIEQISSFGPPRHARKHSRHPTGAAPLPAFNFNPGAPGTSEACQPDAQEPTIQIGSGTGHMRRPSRPEALQPLPPFVFNPAASLPMERTPSPTHPILEEMAMNQHRVSKSAKPAPASAFTFPPNSASGSTSPSRPDPDGDTTKPAGHKRGGSEFVGGKAEAAQLVMTSPSKHDSKSCGPPVSASGFRGHTHRRSQAISISDIDTSDLIKQHALAKARNTSNPSTPQDSSFSFPKGSPGPRHPPSSSRSPPSSPRRGVSMSGYRPRTVDFSEQVDIIPRPLSMISSETERSTSTVRGHSVTNSISSIVSPMPLVAPDTSSPSPTLHEPSPARRPNTADATTLLSSAADQKQEHLLSMPKRPLSASGSPMVSASGSPPPKKKHFWSAHGNEPTPTQTPGEEKGNLLEAHDTVMLVDNFQPRPKTAPERPSNQKRRKYHTWTAGIFSKKSKHARSKKSRRSPTPPALLGRESDNVNDIFDADDTVILREDSPIGARKQPLVDQALPPPPLMNPPIEAATPMLDLDAALDPFVEDRRYSEDQARSTTARIAKLHSSERRGMSDAFGITHRRTESAPALSPVNRSALFGMRQQGSNASLSEEVFDEEEEDNFLAHEEEIKLTSLPQSVEVIQDLNTSPAETGLGLSHVSNQADDVVIVDPDNDENSDDYRSSKSTIEAPAMMVDDLPKRPATSPMPFAYPDPQYHYASSTEGRTTSASLISSPDPDHISFDTQSRPRRLGDISGEIVRSSTDDVPSLSDSASSNAITRGSYSGNARPSLEYRSNSMFVPGSSRMHESWKRSSLASLNRLIPGSSHGSKLRIETSFVETEEKTKKKTNRISKLMRFWRSKETDSK